MSTKAASQPRLVQTLPQNPSITLPAQVFDLSLRWERNSNNLSFGMLRYASVFLDMQDMLCAKLCQTHILTWHVMTQLRDSSKEFILLHEHAVVGIQCAPSPQKRSLRLKMVETHWKKWKNWKTGLIYINVGRKQNCPCSVSKPNYLSNSKAQISSSEMPPEKHVLLAIVESGYQESKRSRLIQRPTSIVYSNLQYSTRMTFIDFPSRPGLEILPRFGHQGPFLRRMGLELHSFWHALDRKLGGIFVCHVHPCGGLSPSNYSVAHPRFDIKINCSEKSSRDESMTSSTRPQHSQTRPFELS